MDFDFNKLASNTKEANDKKEKIAKGALKYIAIKKSFERKKPLYENQIFRKYFTDFYKLDSGSWKSAISQEIFYRIFEGIRVNFSDVSYNLAEASNKNQALLLSSAYSYIYNLLSHVSGYNEKSFSSKVLHTLCNDSPIIDRNILGGFGMSAQEKKGTISSQKATEVYKKLWGFYYSSSDTAIIKKKKNKSEITVYKEKKGFIGYIQENEYIDVKKFKRDFKEMCNREEFKKSFLQDFELLEIRDVDKELDKISLVKIIDFYLWAYFA